ncbi:MAG: zinc ABC transporter substrate-binding protein, partial [Pseudomonadota bacterium]
MQHSPSMPVRRSLFIRFLTLVALTAFVILPAGQAKADTPHKIVATTGMLADLIREIGGDHVTVTGLMGPGVDPHAYRQTRSDIVAMTQADLVVWHGLYLEAQLEEFLLDLADQKPVVALGETVAQDQLLAHDDYEGRFDPHVWMNPRLWQRVTDGAVTALSAQFPQHADDFAAAGEAYKAELARLADYAEQSLATVPQGQRVLITAHDAFNYFGDAYGFDVVGIQGISTESEAGLRRIEELVDRLVTDQVRA